MVTVKPVASSPFHPQDSQDETVSRTVADLEHSNQRPVSRTTVVTMDNSTNKDQPFNNKDLNVKSKKPKLVLIGNSMVRNTGEDLSAGLPHMETFVYSTSGLSIEKAMQQIPDAFGGLHGIRYGGT